MRSLPKKHAQRHCGGFALVVTVSLLALLVLVLVALAQLTRIETSIGFNARREAQAQKNALFALNRAIGELQLHAGPDQRITATAGLLATTPADGRRFWTGVWNADGILQTWLISGNEDGRMAYEPDDAFAGETLVGDNSAGSDENLHVQAPLVELEGTAPDGTTNVTLGRYAWWVGDEGVKASMALPDLTDQITYAPYESAESKRRLRQQVPLTHQSFRATEPAYGFDPAVGGNPSLLPQVLSREQISMLSPVPDAGDSLSSTQRAHFHDWTSSAFGVLASTSPDYPGLKRDLSVDPDLLGPAFASWASGASMELPSTSNTADPPIVTDDDVRRRYRIETPSPASPTAFQICRAVAPVLSEFIIQFGVKRPDISAPEIEVRARMCAALWNPYTSALVPLVPAGLQLEISGLPTISIRASATTRALDLQEFADNEFPSGVSLSWDAAAAATLGSSADLASWLPGRVYYWRTENGVAAPALSFYRKRLDLSDGWLYTATINGLGPGNITLVRNETTSITVSLKTASGEVLAQYEGYPMDAIPEINGTPPSADPSDPSYWLFGFGFRLKQPTFHDGNVTASNWLDAGGGDPRATQVGPGQLMTYFPDGTSTRPTDYAGDISTEWSGAGGVDGLLLHRPNQGANAHSYNFDTPLFELPRTPVLSLGMLQHLQVGNQRPFSLGNSWSVDWVVPDVDANGTVGSWFDRFFFSGVNASTAGPDLGENQPFPYFHLRKYDPDAGLTLNAFRATDYTSQYLLMAGAFNVNSTSIDAWEAVLRSLRPTVPGNWTRADLTQSGSVDSGLAVATPLDDRTQAEGGISAGASTFMRFSQTAQEVYETTAALGGFDRTRYRQGIRGGSEATGDAAVRNLTSLQLHALSAEIVTALREATAAGNSPFVSLEEFLQPSFSSPVSESVIERAIRFAGVNVGQNEMASTFLTQADVLTAIGPLLQARSDTFIIRSYGETTNPVTGDVEARAWCEAIVQRVPDYVNAEKERDLPWEDPSGTNETFGRRFKIVQFRWLTPADI